MPIKDLNKSDTLIHFLNDDAELQGGMYIAAAYQNFITWQNSFLQPIIDAVIHNGILHYYVNNLRKKIPVQNARKNQTLIIDDCFKKSQYINFLELIYTLSKRDIFKEDGTINYINYNSFVYDFAKIEEELGKLILPGLCQFENEDNLNFVAFWSEGFRGGKSDTLSTFYMKYPQKDLNNNEKQIIMNYINSLISTSNNNYDFKEFFGSLQLLTFYLVNNDTKKTEKISNVIRQAPPYLKISNDCSNFFKEDGNQFTLDKLMNIFFFIEFLCFNDLIETLQPEYRLEIPEDIIQRIRQKLLYQNNIENKYTVGDLAAAVRRYISRYLVGRRQTVDIDEKRDLAYDLCRTDLWEEKIGKLNNLDVLILNQLSEFNLKVGQAYAFYRIIAQEERIGIYNNGINNYDYNNNFNNVENEYDNIFNDQNKNNYDNYNNYNNYNNINLENNNHINFIDNNNYNNNNMIIENNNNYNNINFIDNNNYNNNNMINQNNINYNNINFIENNNNNNNINNNMIIENNNNYNNINFNNNNYNNNNNIINNNNIEHINGNNYPNF